MGEDRESIVSRVRKTPHAEIVSWYARHVNPTLATMLKLVGFDREYVRAEGAYVYDADGRRFLDLLSGYGALNLGHNHPAVVAAVQEVLGAPVFLQAAINPFAAALAKRLADITPGDLSISFFSNSGAEAVEGALKMARAATGKPVFVHAEGSFHGKTFGALSVTGREKYRRQFEPLLGPTREVPFGDLEALERALAPEDVACFIVEPIQGEGGVVLPPDGYLKEAEALCRRHGALFVVDEIQTGFGRTGRMFAVEHDGAQPDIMCLAKSLGGGLVPIGATVARREVWERAYGAMDRCLLHTSTFGGNSLSAAAALAAIDVIVEERLPERAASLGAVFLERLRKLARASKIVREVRGRGLMIGLEFVPYEGALAALSRGAATELSREYTAHLVAAELHERFGIITAYTLNNPNVIRIQAPLVIAEDDVEYAVEALSETLSDAGFLQLAAKRGVKTIGKLFRR